MCWVSLTSWLTDLLVTFRPRTTSERRISGVVSPRLLNTDPGKGGKLEAARSNFGGGGTTGTGLGECSSSFFLLIPLWLPLLPRPAPLRYPLCMVACGASLKLKESRETVVEVVPVSVPYVWRGCGLMGTDRPSIRVPGVKEEGGTSPGLG